MPKKLDFGEVCCYNTTEIALYPIRERQQEVIEYEKVAGYPAYGDPGHAQRNSADHVLYAPGISEYWPVGHLTEYDSRSHRSHHIGPHRRRFSWRYVWNYQFLAVYRHWRYQCNGCNFV